MLSGGQLGTDAHWEFLVQALVKRSYLVKSIAGCVYLGRFARGSGTGIASPLFIKLGTWIRLKVLGQAGDIDGGKEHAAGHQKQRGSSHLNSYSLSTNTNTVNRWHQLHRRRLSYLGAAAQ